MIFSQSLPAPPEAAPRPVLLLRADGLRRRVAGGAGCAVAPCARAVPVPHAPAWLLGIAVHEGEAIPLVDLAAALGDGCAPRPGARARMLITHGAGCALAYAVDAIDADDGRDDAAALDLDALGRSLLARALAPWSPA